MEIERISFMDAVKLIAERHGIQLPRKSDYSDAESRKRATLLEMQNLAMETFLKALRSDSGRAAREYLEQRGLDEGLIQHFQIGYAEESGRALVRYFQNRRIPESLYEESGLLLPRRSSGYYDRFRGRVMFPIHDETGKTVGFGGRILEKNDQPKYMNSPETPIYRKSQVLYNLNRAKSEIRKTGFALLVEGYMDVIGAWAADVRCAVAPCGTSLTKEQVRSLKRHADTVVLNFDPDAAGARAAERSIQLLLDEGVHVKVLQLEDGLDPYEFVRQQGAEAYRQRLERASDFFRWLAGRLRSRFDFSQKHERARALEKILPFVQRLPNDLRRQTAIREVQAYLDIEEGPVLRALRQQASGSKAPEKKLPREEVNAWETFLVQAFLSDQEVLNDAAPVLRQLQIWKKARAMSVLECILRLHEKEGSVSYDSLHARLEKDDQNLLAFILSEDVIVAEENLRSQVVACLEKLDAMEINEMRKDLKRQIRECEQAGDLSGALRLSDKLAELEKGVR
jgi:DNA primase